jgi:tRNA U34 5-methylaminomethyl-2-thiouridine-forming methyltransferase MnmC
MTNIKNNHYTPLIPEEAAMALVREWSLRERNGDKNARQLAAQELKAFLVETADGTYTLKSEIKDDSSETMHTTHGALREAREKFAEPSQLRGRKNIAILDICSGLGVNAAAALENLKDPIQGWKMEHLVLDMVEISWETLAATLIIPRISEYHDIIRKAVENYLVDHGLLAFSREEKKYPHLWIFGCTVRMPGKWWLKFQKLRSMMRYFWIPSARPDHLSFYTNEFLSKLANLLKNDGVILTYTSAAPVRYALLNAGLEIGEGPVLGRSGGTIASPSRNRITKPLKAADERMVPFLMRGYPTEILI